MPFRFCDESVTPDQQLFTDVQSLNSFSAPQLAQFSTIVLGFLKEGGEAEGVFCHHSFFLAVCVLMMTAICGGQRIVDRGEAIPRFAEEHGINQKALRGTLRGLLFFFVEALRRNMPPQHVKEDLLNLGRFSNSVSLPLPLRYSNLIRCLYAVYSVQGWRRTRQLHSASSGSSITSPCPTP